MVPDLEIPDLIEIVFMRRTPRAYLNFIDVLNLFNIL